MPEKKTSDQIAKNVAQKAKKISPNKSALTQELANRRDELIAFLNDLPVSIRVKTLSLALAQITPTQIQDKEEALEVVNLFRSKPFLLHMAKVVESTGIEGALDELAELDLDNPVEVLKVFTGESFTPEEIREMLGENEW